MKLVVLLSGGVDSAVLLGHRFGKGDECLAVTFDYGQTHVREIDAARAVAHHYGAEHRIIPLRGIFAECALTGRGDIPVMHADEPDATTVPARNLVMLSIAAALGEGWGASAVVFGANADDMAGYRDCRPVFIDAIREAVCRGTNLGGIYAPLISMSKDDILNLGKEIDVPLHLTWSCYRGGDTPCGACGACESKGGAF